ncbi:MAG: hypothetical protein FWE97_00845 [Dehalococcoidia bacterium]|nr:hypothetical protein [Dehalococcoidia bacterium]
MKMVNKRVYCPIDKKLVRPRVQQSVDTTKLVCPNCSTVIYVQENWGWRFPKNGEPVASAKK